MRHAYIPQHPSGLALFTLGAYTEDEAWQNVVEKIEPWMTTRRTKEQLIELGFKVQVWSPKVKVPRALESNQS